MREIETIHDRIESNVQELERRVPKPALWLKRLIAGGMAAVILLSVLWRMRMSTSRKPLETSRTNA
jgi:hypothetical protein